MLSPKGLFGFEAKKRRKERRAARYTLRSTFPLPIDRKKLRFFIAIALLYTAVAFAYSFIGFLHYEPGSHYHEYAPAKLFVEVGGHVLFGFIAAIPFLDLEVWMLTASLAILIDIDHLLSALNFDVNGRPDHSIIFAILSTVFLIYISGKAGLSKQVRVKLAFISAVALLSHLAYDIFASGGSSFPVFVPFSFQTYNLAFNTWLYLEIAAFLLALVALVFSLRIAKSEKGLDDTRAQERRKPGLPTMRDD